MCVCRRPPEACSTCMTAAESILLAYCTYSRRRHSRVILTLKEFRSMNKYLGSLPYVLHSTVLCETRTTRTTTTFKLIDCDARSENETNKRTEHRNC